MENYFHYILLCIFSFIFISLYLKLKVVQLINKDHLSLKEQWVVDKLGCHLKKLNYIFWGGVIFLLLFWFYALYFLNDKLSSIM